MSDQLIVEHCSPTLAGIKTGNLFTVRMEEERDIIGEIRELNRLLTKKGLRAVPVRRTAKHTMIYLYRPDFLKRDLNVPEAVEILEKKGYRCESTSACIAHLIHRLMTERTFPHEIGLFLGYPPADVKGFMNSPCDGVKCSGCWKAYGNEEEAERTFCRYKRCTEAYQRALRRGRPLAKMIVSRKG